MSLLLARKTGEWVVYNQSDPLKERPKVTVEPAALRETLAYNDEYYTEIEETLRSSHQSYLTLHYEDLFTDDERLRLLRFLGVSRPHLSALKEETVRLNASPLPDLIENFEELSATLRGTDLELELHDSLG